MATDVEHYDELLRSDFRLFVQLAFGELMPKLRFQTNWHIDVMASEIDKIRRGDTTRLIINLPPRSLKSIVTSVAFPAWVLGHNPNAQIICVSYAQDLAEKMARDCRTIMESSFYRRLFDTRLSSKKQAVGEYETTAGGFRLSTSIGGVLTGRGGDLIIIDDPLKPDDALSRVRRPAVNEWFDHTLYSRLNNKMIGAIMIVMQRLHEDDLTGHVLQQEAWHQVMFPAIAVADEAWTADTARGHQSFTRAAGLPLHPEREPLLTLDVLRKRLGEAMFQAQYQQTPTPPDGLYIKRNWFLRYERAPTHYDAVIQSWDTASKTSELNDYSVCITLGIIDGIYHILDVFRERIEFPELKRAVRDLANKYDPSKILIEDRASGIQLIQELRSEGFYDLVPFKPENDKEMRVYAQSALIESGAVRLPEAAAWVEAFLHELTTFPNARNDDQADALAQALSWAKAQQLVPGIIQFYRNDKAARDAGATEMWLIEPPPGITHLYRRCGTAVLLGNGPIELPQDEAILLQPYGWTVIRRPPGSGSTPPLW